MDAGLHDRHMGDCWPQSMCRWHPPHFFPPLHQPLHPLVHAVLYAGATRVRALHGVARPPHAAIPGTHPP
eukprot:648993-Prorocentrum_lima.AAC.1